MKATPLLAAAAAALLFAGAAFSTRESDEGQQARALAVYEYGADVELRDLLIAKGRMYDDLGGWILGEADAALGAAYTMLPQLAEGETLLTIVQHGHPEAVAALGQSGRAVWTEPGGQVGFRAYAAAELLEFAGHGFRCHGSVRPVNLGAPIQPSVFHYPGAGSGSGGTINMISPKPAIQGMVAQVSQANITADVNSLVAFGTRRHDQPGAVNAQNWLVGEFQAMGLSTSTFNFDSGADVVVAEQLGATDPGKIVIIGGHYDSINYDGSTAPAPGADDDASGVAAVLEIARILSQHTFDYTIRYCPWSGEELGLLGSEAYAASLDSSNADVVAMVQLDMIAYRANGDTRSVDFVLNDTTPALNQFAMDVYMAYVPTLQVNSGSLSGGTSDHRSFFNHGFAATFPFEDLGQYSPFIHGPNDTVGTSANDFVLARLITQGALATMAELARPVSMLLNHTALGDSQNDAGPYTPVLTAVPNNGETVTSADLYWREGGGAWQQVAMSPTGNPDEWSGDIPGQTSPAFMDYYLVATDSGGNTAWLPEGFTAGENSYSFLVGTVNSLVLQNFDGGNDNGWTHAEVATQDDWMRGVPQGKAGDPSSAFSGSNVWGNDLGPSGWNGFYADNVSNYLQSPAFDLTGASNTYLRFQRWLGVEESQFDQAIIRINGTEVWRNPVSGNLIDSSWTEFFLDVSALADNNPSVVVRFELQSDGGLTFGGWNIDDFEIVEIGPSPGGPTVDTINLTLSAPTVIPGNAVTFDWDSAPGSSPQWLYASKRMNGTTINGQPFDIGPGLKTLVTGSTSPAGTGSWNSGPVPGRFGGRTFYFEVRVDNGGQTYDSNMVSLQIL